MVRKLLFGLVGLLLLIAMIPVAVIALNAPVSPPAMASMATSSGEGKPDFPAPRQFQARDGTSLQYRVYPAAMNNVAILIHGSAFPGTSMHALAEALHAAGVTVYVPDVRGHGGSGRRGGIEYVGQIEDDPAKFVHPLGPWK